MDLAYASQGRRSYWGINGLFQRRGMEVTLCHTQGTHAKDIFQMSIEWLILCRSSGRAFIIISGKCDEENTMMVPGNFSLHKLHLKSSFRYSPVNVITIIFFYQSLAGKAAVCQGCPGQYLCSQQGRLFSNIRFLK